MYPVSTATSLPVGETLQPTANSQQPWPFSCLCPDPALSLHHKAHLQPATLAKHLFTLSLIPDTNLHYPETMARPSIHNNITLTARALMLPMSLQLALVSSKTATRLGGWL